MDKSILIGGAAGQGTAVTSHFIGKVFCQLGYYVFNYRDYPSLITGGHNFNILKISDRPVYSQKDNNFDIILALDQKTIDLHQKKLNKGGFILGRGLDISHILKKLNAPKIIENDVLIGCFFKHFGVGKEVLFETAKKVFGDKSDLIEKAVAEGYNLVETKEKLENNGNPRYFISGTEAMGSGAILAGLDIYMAYPMTPATPLLNFLAKRQVKDNILVLQLENEIGIVNAALGASFAGAKTMVGTSGGGFALMAEAFSLAGMAELPLVFYWGQRTGPSTGLPTYTGQGDLKFALNIGHGEFPRIVVAPGDPKETIIRTQEAFYFSDKYRLPVIILGDKHLAESNYAFDELLSSSLPNKKFILDNPPGNYKSYQITKNGVSPRAVPGQGPVVRAVSYEHDEFGLTTEDRETVVKMQDKRLRKLDYFKKEIDKLNPVSAFGRGKNLIIGWGSTKGAILDSLPGLNGFKFLQISYLNPFPAEAVKKEIKKSKRVVLVENSATGSLADVIAEKTGLIIKEKVLRYDGRPFTSEFLIGKIKKQKK